MATLEPHHHRSSLAKITSEIREIVFGLGDGLVSTMGAITGIAGATHNTFFVILSGFVIVSVEAISMGVGEYLSSKSEKEVWRKKITEEEREIKEQPERERLELKQFYREKGLTDTEVEQVTAIVAKHPAWVVEEMAIHELGVSPIVPHSPVRGALFMFLAYIAGGIVPIIPYFFVVVDRGIFFSVLATAIALFFIGALKARYTTGRWFKGGLEMMLLSLTAAAIGYSVGQLVERYAS